MGRLLLAAGLSILLSTIALADPPQPSRARRAVNAVRKELHRYGKDAVGMTTAPLHWDAHAWTRFAQGTGVIAAVGLADKTFYEAVQRNRSSFTDDFSDAMTPLGGRDALYTAGGMIAYGALADRDRLRETGRDALEAELWAAGVVTPLLKRAFGRARPIHGEGVSSFHPFSKDHQSFPSGHATNAFALATVIAEHYRGTIVAPIVYGIATGVAFSRVNDEAHFPSDVVAGALIGRAVGRSIVARHSGAPAGKVRIVPLMNRYGQGILIEYSW